VNPAHKVIVLAVDQLLILIAYSSQSINVAGFVNVKLALGSFTNVLIPSSISQFDTVLVTQDLSTHHHTADILALEMLKLDTVHELYIKSTVDTFRYQLSINSSVDSNI
jgi:hypothetical protein